MVIKVTKGNSMKHILATLTLYVNTMQEIEIVVIFNEDGTSKYLVELRIGYQFMTLKKPKYNNNMR